MVLCLIVCCGKRSGRDGQEISFYRVPRVIDNEGDLTQETTTERRRLWVSAISRDDLTDKILDNDRVCSRHFVSGRPAPPWDRHNVDWVPTLNLGHAKQKQKDVKSVNERAQRASDKRKRDIQREHERKEKLKRLEEAGERVQSIFSSVDAENGGSATGESTPFDIEESMSENCNFDSNPTEFSQATQESSTQTEEFDYLFNAPKEKPFDEDYFNDDEKTRFYTGLPSVEILKRTFDFVAPYLTRTPPQLSKFQEFILVLMKLRLNVPLQDLAYHFGISLSTVSRIFAHWLLVLDTRLAPLIHWPEREDLWRTMPQCFLYSFGKKVTVIIDCFEVFIDRPTNLLARAQTFSNYKHHNTAKVLIGITPQGTICFVSEAWGGRTSDKYLTENCGILKHLIPGDLVLADRGFTIHESVWYHQAQLNIPAFTRGKDQLDPVDVETTRGIANVRIHVERVIGTLRQKYTILQSTLPTDFLMCNNTGPQERSVPLLDRMLRVCSALVNLCPPIVSFD